MKKRKEKKNASYCRDPLSHQACHEVYWEQDGELCWPRFPNLFMDVPSTIFGLDISSFKFIKGSLMNYHLSFLVYFTAVNLVIFMSLYMWVLPQLYSLDQHKLLMLTITPLHLCFLWKALPSDLSFNSC